MVGYEWVIEAVDEYGDIQSITHADILSKAFEYKDFFHTEGWERVEIGLVRDVGDDIDGLQNRQWAYLEDDKLPATFDGGAKIPKRFLEEVSKKCGDSREVAR